MQNLSYKTYNNRGKQDPNRRHEIEKGMFICIMEASNTFAAQKECNYFFKSFGQGVFPQRHLELLSRFRDVVLTLAEPGCLPDLSDF